MFVVRNHSIQLSVINIFFYLLVYNFHIKFIFNLIRTSTVLVQ